MNIQFFNPLKAIPNYIALLQLENYDVGRFFRVVLKMLNKNKFPEKRKGIEWTIGLKAITCGAILVALIDIIVILWILSPFLSGINEIVVTFIIIYLSTLFFFAYLGVSTFLLQPFERYRTQKLITEATRRIAKRPDLIIIGIVGSYGKTTMKEALLSVLSTEKKVLATKGNENTAIGISRRIIHDLKPDHEVFIVEMGEHVPGDIKELCEIVPPHHAVITGINEAHLERMGSLENTISTIFEIVQYSRPDTLFYVNMDDDRLRQEVPARIKHPIQFSKNPSYSEVSVSEKENSFDQANPQISYEVSHNNYSGVITTPLLGNYMGGVIAVCFSVATRLGIHEKSIEEGCESLKPIEHRLQTIRHNDGSLLIDDSYNGNIDGVREGLYLLKRFTNYNKIYVTPGLVEVGEDSERLHIQIGEMIADVADKVFLIDTPPTRWVKESLIKKGFNESYIITYPTMPTALAALGVERTSKDVMLIQNDWTENYE